MKSDLIKQKIQAKQLNQEGSKVNQTISDNNSSSGKSTNDVLYISYQLKPGQIKKFKIKAGTLIFEQPFIILSMQDISSELTLNNLKMKSTENDIIYMKSINEIRDKVGKLINTVCSSRFFNLKTMSNITKNDRAQNDAYPIITVAQIEQQFLNESKSQQLNQQIQDNQDLKSEISRVEELRDFTPIDKCIHDQITFQPYSQNNSLIQNDKQSVDINPNDDNTIQIYQEQKGKNQIPINHESNNFEQTKQLQGDISPTEYNHQKKYSNDIGQVKSNVLLIPGQMIEQNTPQLLQQNLNSAQYKANENYRIQNLKEKDELSECSELKSMNSNRRPSNPNQQMFQNYINSYKTTKRRSFNQSYCEGDTLQFIEDDDFDSKIAYLKMSLSCLLNNTYSLLDYMILSNEKSYFKKLSIKPQQIHLRKLDGFLKQLFPNLIIQYQNIELQEKEINTDVRRLKYILVSILSSFIFKKKMNEQPANTSYRFTDGLQILQPDQYTPSSQNKKFNTPNFQAINFEYYDKLIDIYLVISHNEQSQFKSISFSIYTLGSINLQTDNNINQIQIPNLQPSKYKYESNYIPNSRQNKKNEQEFLNIITQANFCFNATQDPTINQMEAKNIYCNIMRIGPYIPEYEIQSNLFQFDVFEDIEVINSPSKNICSPNTTAQNLIQGTPSNQVLTTQQPKSAQNLQSFQFETQTAKSSRKSNFFSGNVSPSSNYSQFIQQEIQKKNGQQKNKQNVKENLSKQKQQQVHEIKKLEIAIIKENIQSFNEECYTDSYRTFVSGEDKDLEEHLQESIYAQKLPRSIWDIEM